MNIIMPDIDGTTTDGQVIRDATLAHYTTNDGRSSLRAFTMFEAQNGSEDM